MLDDDCISKSIPDDQQETNHELSFFLGAMFYPRILKEGLGCEEKRSEVDLIHDTLY